MLLSCHLETCDVKVTAVGGFVPLCDAAILIRSLKVHPLILLMLFVKAAGVLSPWRHDSTDLRSGGSLTEIGYEETKRVNPLFSAQFPTVCAIVRCVQQLSIL